MTPDDKLYVKKLFDELRTIDPDSLQFEDTPKSLNLVNGKDDRFFEITATETIANDENLQLIQYFEENLEECGDTDLLEDYIRNSAAGKFLII